MVACSRVKPRSSSSIIAVSNLVRSRGFPMISFHTLSIFFWVTSVQEPNVETSSRRPTSRSMVIVSSSASGASSRIGSISPALLTLRRLLSFFLATVMACRPLVSQLSSSLLKAPGSAAFSVSPGSAQASPCGPAEPFSAAALAALAASMAAFSSFAAACAASAAAITACRSAVTPSSSFLDATDDVAYPRSDFTLALRLLFPILRLH
mmetsp:Transcript_23359/g.41317  ORF Transcript_23359/g.41317 Transcript_23359/m.41317 type:complete len:208 (+) Transcript_23359:306-929(+)